MHIRHFGERLHCPGEKGYQWNPELASKESVAFGSPEAPRGEPHEISLLENWMFLKDAGASGCVLDLPLHPHRIGYVKFERKKPSACMGYFLY